MDSSAYLTDDGGRADDVRAHRIGDRPRACGHSEAALSNLAGMSDAARMLTGINTRWFIAVFLLMIFWTTVNLPYRRLAELRKWLVVVLFAHPVITLIVRLNWSEVACSTLHPSLPHGRPEWFTLVAILGTTISPYLFFWQTSAEIEEEIGAGRTSLEQGKGATDEEIAASRIDVSRRRDRSRSCRASTFSISPVRRSYPPVWLALPPIRFDRGGVPPASFNLSEWPSQSRSYLGVQAAVCVYSLLANSGSAIIRAFSIPRKQTRAQRFAAIPRRCQSHPLRHGAEFFHLHFIPLLQGD